ncbi:hypothetical protein GCM10022233_82280 [Streptomyces shaanxiensis]|uniref:Uncharacterized protein n=1 Tax=Streptomyces shaanxiensis TaxID=653357 RepID=A0ABP7WE26_9ACTN
MASCRAGSAASFASDGGGGGASAPAARGWTSAAASAVTATAATRPIWVVRRLDGDGHLAITDGLLAITALMGPTPRETYRRRKDYSKRLETIGKDFHQVSQQGELVCVSRPSRQGRVL